MRVLTWHATFKILVLAVITTAVIPVDFLIPEAPPTPPCRDPSSLIKCLWAEILVLSAYSGSRIPSQSITSLMRATVGVKCPPESYMKLRERFDFAILVCVFSSLLAASVIRLPFPS